MHYLITLKIIFLIQILPILPPTLKTFSFFSIGWLNDFVLFDYDRNDLASFLIQFLLIFPHTKNILIYFVIGWSNDISLFNYIINDVVSFLIQILLLLPRNDVTSFNLIIINLL